MSRERIVRANGVALCVETFGDPAHPAILLIGGGASSMDWWEDEFCKRLAAGLRFVIRYDHRDTGRSTSYAPGAPPYTMKVLARDASGLLDALEVKSAHLVGMSMGGTIAVYMALDQSARVATLTLVSTSPGAAGPGKAKLPPMSRTLQEFFAKDTPPPDWRDRSAVIEYIVDGSRPFAGARGFDEAHLRSLAGRVFDRTTNMEASFTNHAAVTGGGAVRARLGELKLPTLVIHGTADPLFPYGHAQALASEIAGARLLPLEGVGHEMPPAAVWDVVIPAILSHSISGQEAPD